jgi:CHAT domain
VDDTSYADLDLLIERSGRNFRARVLASPAGSTTPIDFPPPIGKDKLQIFVLTVGRPRQGVRRIDAPIEHEVKELGGRLYRSVFREQIRDCLKESEMEARRQGQGLRLRLHLDVAASNLPWEYLFDEAGGRFLSLSRLTPVVRYLEIDDVPKPLRLDPPLHVLGVIASPSDYPGLDVATEWARLKDALSPLEEAGVVDVELLSTATVDELLEVLQRGTYHVLHFIGHGGFRESSDEGVVLFEDGAGQSHQVTGEELGILLQDHPTLRLVVLNSCEGARGGVGDPFSGTAQSLVRRRIPAVVAMQFEITDTAALRFSRSFYGALASNYPVDAAVAESRRWIRLSGNTFEWGTPVLYMLAPDGRLFELPKEAEERAREASEQEEVEPGGDAGTAEREQTEREREERERAERERAAREQAERERAESERLERERLEQQRLAREQAERDREERERVERERARRIRVGFVVVCSVSAAALIVAAFGPWGSATAKPTNAFHRQVELIFGEPPIPPTQGATPWFARLGLYLVIVAAVALLMAIIRRRVWLGLLGALVVVSTLLFIWHFHQRAPHDPNTPPAIANDSLMASIEWGEWLAIVAGSALVAASLLSERLERKR